MATPKRELFGKQSLYVDDHHLVPSSICLASEIDDPNFEGNVLRGIDKKAHQRGIHRLVGNLVPWRTPYILYAGPEYYWVTKDPRDSYRNVFGNRQIPEAILLMERLLIPRLTDDHIVAKLVKHGFIDKQEERYLETLAGRHSSTRSPLWEKFFDPDVRPQWLHPLSRQKFCLLRTAA